MKESEVISRLSDAIEEAVRSLERGEHPNRALKPLKEVEPILDRYFQEKKAAATMVRCHPDGALYQVTYPGLRCATCGCNVFHETSDGTNVSTVCNGCGNLIGALTAEAAHEALEEGTWQPESKE